MTRINLLPWRENLRKKRQRDFGMGALLAVIITAGLCGGIHFYIQDMIDHQNKRNRFLEKEIAAMEEKIKEIKDLEKTKENLLARMEVIQQLQTSRPQVVHLFDEMVNTIPDGIYLTSVQQKGGSLSLEGKAQSNARVSAYMRNIENAPWVTKPDLSVITSKEQDGGLSDFTLTANQTSPKKKEGEQ